MTKKRDKKTIPSPEFYTVSYYQTDEGQEKKVKRISIKLPSLVGRLMEIGFQRLDKDDTYFYIRVEENVVEEVDQTLIIDQFEDWINTFPDPLPGKYELKKDALKHKMYAGINTYFSPNILNRMRAPEKVEFAEDSKREALFFYRNGYVSVTKNDIKLLPYSNLGNKKVFKSQILERDFERLSVSKFDNSSWAQFVYNIANNYKNKDTGQPNDPHRAEVLKCIIGYNLHKFFQGKLKATIFTDSSLSDAASGRSGKTLLMKGLGRMLNREETSKAYVEINGKNFDIGDKFRYQECRLDTNLIHINDVQKGLDIEQFFNDISEGVKARRLHKEVFLVLCKIVFSSNRTIKIDGDSAEDRVIEFEMSDHYNGDFSPLQEFGHWFFNDWNDSQWLQYDNFMLHCVQLYFNEGLMKPNAINLNRRKLLEETCIEFVNWMDEKSKTILSDLEQPKFELKIEFTDMYTDFSQRLTSRKFTQWLRIYTKYSPDFVTWTDSHERRSNNTDYFKFHRLYDASEGSGLPPLPPPP